MSEQPVYKAPVYGHVPPPAGSAVKRTTLIAITVLVVLGGVTFLAIQSMGAATLYRHVEELQANKSRYLEAKVIQIQGYARNVPREGRIEGEKIYREFDVTTIGGDHRVRVVHEGVVPDTFKEMAQVTAMGKLTEGPDGRLVLTTVGGEKGLGAKCPSKYEEK
jgi:cytochrome c-type biogenesis protein CcmE